MTCIVGIAKDGVVCIGGDHAGVQESNGWSGADIIDVKRPKVFIKDKKVIFGYTSSFRMAALLEFKLTLPALYAEMDLDKWIHNEFIDACRTAFKDGGYGAVKDGRGEHGGYFLFGVRGRLFVFQEDFSALETRNGYHSVGSGAHLALGSLFSTQLNEQMTPSARVQIALEAAAFHTNGVRPPFAILTLEGSKA